MRIYILGVPYMGITSALTDRELMVIVQAHQRKLLKAKIRVTFMGEDRLLSVEAICLARTLPDVVFEPTVIDALPLAAEPCGSAFLPPSSVSTS